jgi:hypothetical protein
MEEIQLLDSISGYQYMVGNLRYELSILEQIISVQKIQMANLQQSNSICYNNFSNVLTVVQVIAGLIFFFLVSLSFNETIAKTTIFLTQKIKFLIWKIRKK